MADIILLAFLLLGIFMGWRKGTINVLGGIGAIIFGYIAARNFSAYLAVAITDLFPVIAPKTEPSDAKGLLSAFIDMEVVANRIVQVLAFIIIFVVVSFVIKKLAHFLSDLLRNTLVGKLNSAIGAFLGFLFAILLTAIAIDMVLPVFARFSWGENALAFVAGSQIILPSVYAFVGVLIANLPRIAELYKQG
ncbi:MAG: CvpA family protein [Clostridiales bacterium]|nr:CvpA family protein [Clostridiales bacterium]